MEELTIENPNNRFYYSIEWEKFKGHILNVVNTFPNEYKIINAGVAKDRISIFNPIINPASGSLQNDRMLSVIHEGIGKIPGEINVRFEATNQNNKITS